MAKERLICWMYLRGLTILLMTIVNNLELGDVIHRLKHAEWF
jgi:predicted acyltransferase